MDVPIHFHSTDGVQIDGEFYMYSICGVKVDAIVNFHSIFVVEEDAGTQLTSTTDTK